MEEGDGEDQFLAISAVADEGFLVDEEEDDYEDLYNDVNVGGVFQSFNREEDVDEVGFRDQGQGDEKKIEGFSREEEKGVGSGVDTKTEVEQSPVVESGSIVGGMRVEFADSSIRMGESEGESQIRSSTLPPQESMQQSQGVALGNAGSNQGVGRQGAVNGGIGTRGGGGTMLFVGDLHWWTTDAELETELCKYGHVKEVNFFDEKASGKSKGYCQVEFYGASAATACKEGMNGHVFNGKPCVVQYASPFSIKRMAEAQVNKNQAMVQSNSNFPPGRRGMGDAGNGGGRGGGNNMPMGGGYQGGDGNRSYGRGNWGRGNGQGMGGRGQGGPMRNRGGMSGGRGMMGNGFGQGMAPNPHMMHPQSMMGQGFDPAYGPNMGRMGGYGGFPVGPAPPFSGMMPSFPPVGGISMPGVAPHVNSAFFGRGMPTNGMGMMPPTGMDGHGMGMWSDPNSSGWVGEEPGGRVAESSYGEDATSEYGDANNDRGGRLNPMKEKDRMSERDWSGPNRKYWDDRDPESDRDIPWEKDGLGGRESSRERERARDRDRDRGRDSYRYKEDIDPDRDHYREDRDQDRDRYRDDRERYMDPHRYKDRGPEYDTVDHRRYKDRELEYDDEWERGRSSRVYGKPHLSYEEEHPARSRDIEYSKRRRLPSE